MKFKQWLLKSYIEEDSFHKMVENDATNLVSKRVITENQKETIMRIFKTDAIIFIDFMLKEGVVKLIYLDC